MKLIGFSESRARPIVARALGGSVGVAVLWVCVGTPAIFGQEVPPPAVEHHLHIRSLAGAKVTEQFAEPGEDRPNTEPEETTAADALEALGAASVDRALVLSIAYMFGAPDVTVENEYELVRQENDYVAEQVATAPERLLGACSVNPLADYALEEIERCAADPRLAALKLHLANSDVDLENDAHVEKLVVLFEKLAELELPVVVHLRNRAEGYGAREATIFVEQVLSRAPRLPVQIAHMAGWGGYDEATDAALSVFAQALSDGRLDPHLISFDLAAVVFQPEAAGEDQDLARKVREANQQLAARIRQIGVDRVVFATDWPSWPPVPDSRQKITLNARLVEQALPLSADELTRVFANVSTVVRASPRRARN